MTKPHLQITADGRMGRPRMVQHERLEGPGEGASFEEMRSAYLARVLGVDPRRVLSTVRAWNRMTDAEKAKSVARPRVAV